MIWYLTGCILLSSGKIELKTTETIDTTDCEEKTVYQDLDGDGYGGSEEFNLCNTEGYISVGGDCNDDDAQIHPEATEICDEIDNDCDQLIDDNDHDLSDNQPVYADNDGDGYGGTQEYFFCTPPSTYVDNDHDCDDSDETSTNRLIDNDCDQSQNEIGCISIEVEESTTSGDSITSPSIVIFENLSFLEDSDPVPVASFYLDTNDEYCSSATTLSLKVNNAELENDIDFELFRNSTQLIGEGTGLSNGPLVFEDELYLIDFFFLEVGIDCDDNNPSYLDITNDLDCDGIVAVEDCDDNNPSSTIISEDHDCDNLTNDQDTIFDGDYWIEGEDSQLKLDRIQSYQEISGDLYIQETTVTELQLNSLISVNNITIEDNSEIEEITGFNSLSEVNQVIIKSNESLTSLQGFSGLDRIDGALQIINNDMLAQITFSNITYIDSLWLTNNANLTLNQVSFLADSGSVTIPSCYSDIGWCPEICGNNFDDDFDGDVDCADAECETSASCQDSNNPTD